MKRMLSMLPYWIVILLTFYLLPLLIQDTGMAILMMICVIPFICFVCSIVYGFKTASISSTQSA